MYISEIVAIVWDENQNRRDSS